MSMTGAEILVHTLLAGGVDTCFTNPGTTEMHLVAALDRIPEMRCVLGLFEGVVTGAADGYARIADRPAWTLLHLGPGLANGLANLHNASRAQTPVLNIVGQHATFHLRHDTPLTSDIEAIARPYSDWLRTSSSALQIGFDTADAIAAARKPPGRISTLIVPADVAWGEGRAPAAPPRVTAASVPPCSSFEQAARMLRNGLPTAVLVSGNALYGAGLKNAGRITNATGAKLLAPYPFARIERGAGHPPVERVAYILEQAQAQLKEFRQLIVVGAPPPVAYFGSHNKDAIMTAPDCDIFSLAEPGQDLAASMEILAHTVSAHKIEPQRAMSFRPRLPAGEVTTQKIAEAVAALLPENAIVVDESMTSGRALLPATQGSPSHDWLGNTGGSIGIALPLALGASIASPDRRVLCLTADGSALYTAQALWSMARESANITVVVFANRSYAVLKREFGNLGIGAPGPRALDLFDLSRPDLDWVHMAQGFGVPAHRAVSMEDFVQLLEGGLSSAGPSLIEVPL
jgi:acetolactate synthase I/II/III large subunit